MPRKYNRISSDDLKGEYSESQSQSNVNVNDQHQNINKNNQDSTSTSTSTPTINTSMNRTSNNSGSGSGSSPRPRRRHLKSPSSTSVASVSSASHAGNNPANKSIGERISAKFHALLWIMIALFTGYQTDIIETFLSSSKPIRPLLHLAITQLTINFILMIYLGVYLPKIRLKGVKYDNVNSEGSGGISVLWSVYCPRVIPFMTANGLVCFCVMFRGLWPVYGFLTPFILAIESIGLLFLTEFIPWI